MIAVRVELGTIFLMFFIISVAVIFERFTGLDKTFILVCAFMGVYIRDKLEETK